MYQTAGQVTDGSGMFSISAGLFRDNLVVSESQQGETKMPLFKELHDKDINIGTSLTVGVYEYAPRLNSTGKVRKNQPDLTLHYNDMVLQDVVKDIIPKDIEILKFVSNNKYYLYEVMDDVYVGLIGTTPASIRYAMYKPTDTGYTIMQEFRFESSIRNELTKMYKKRL